MPTYEYKCENCDHLFEHFQTMTSKPLRKCPECGKNLGRMPGLSKLNFCPCCGVSMDQKLKDDADDSP